MSALTSENSGGSVTMSSSAPSHIYGTHHNVNMQQDGGLQVSGRFKDSLLSKEGIPPQIQKIVKTSSSHQVNEQFRTDAKLPQEVAINAASVIYGLLGDMSTFDWTDFLEEDICYNSCSNPNVLSSGASTGPVVGNGVSREIQNSSNPRTSIVSDW
jgi:hypothetical protein